MAVVISKASNALFAETAAGHVILTFTAASKFASRLIATVARYGADAVVDGVPSSLKLADHRAVPVENGTPYLGDAFVVFGVDRKSAIMPPVRLAAAA